jgi:Transposase DDE domain group 1
MQRLRRAKWAVLRRAGSRQKRTFRRSLISPANGSTAFMVAARREVSCSTLDSSVSPTHGEQENSVWNGHYGCTCYHPLFVFNQFGDLERCSLRPGNVHSADGWDGVLKPFVARYRGKVSRIYFRADAGFANPDVYGFLEAEGIKYAIRVPANRVLQERIGHLLKRPVGRPSNDVRRSHASFSYQAGSWSKPRRVIAKVEWHLGELYPRVGFIVTNMSRAAENVVVFYNKRGTCEQWIKEGKGAIRWTQLCARSPPMRSGFNFMRSPTTSAIFCARWPRPNRSRTVADEPEGKADQDRREGRQPWTLRRLPDGQSRCSKNAVCRHFAADCRVAAASSSINRVRRLLNRDLSPTHGRIASK